MALSTEEQRKLGNEIVRAIVRYLIIGIIGIVVIGFAASVVKIAKVKEAISGAEILLQANRPVEAFDQISRLERWAMPYPEVYRSLVCTAIKCHVRLTDIASARKAAKNLVDGQYRGFIISIDPVYLFQMMRDSVVNMFLSSAAEDLTEWAGYQTLVSELRAAGGYEEMIRELESEMPNSALTVSSTQAGNEWALPRKKPALPPVQPIEKPEGASDAAEITASSRGLGHCELAEDHISKKKWDEAVRECDSALAANADDSRARTLRKIAEARGNSWGVVMAYNTKAYTESGGAFPGTFDAGTTVELTGLRRARGGALAICTVPYRGGELSGLMIPLHDLDITAGLLSEANEQTKKLKVKQAQLTAEIIKISSVYAEERSKRNPHAAEYAAAKAAYNEFWIKAKSLTVQRNAATGDDRLRYIDELHKLKGQDIKVSQALEAAKKKNKEWEDANPIEPVNDQKLAGLQAELADIQDKLRQAE